MANDDWYENAVIYALDVETFQDTDGDGVGDFRGLTDRLDYLEELGVDCLWLLPFYATPNRDNGYDVMDYYAIDDRLGDLGDFVVFLEEAKRRDIRVIVDLVVNHTSDRHPWFEAARGDPDSKYRDYYVWSTDPPPADPEAGSVFPGEVEDERIWTYDSEAGAYYFHRFYPFQPDLNVANPDVREEIEKVMRFWLELGVSGFRVDAATLMIQRKDPAASEPDDPRAILWRMREVADEFDAVLLAEADDHPDELASYFDREFHLLLNFVLNAHLTHALAEGSGDPIAEAFERLPDVHGVGQWANFLRNFDELNIGRLPRDQREAVFELFAPDPSMRIYGRGIRRRLAPILDGDGRRIRTAFSLLFSMPGTPLFFYGDEIGMGDDQSLPGRDAVRTPMQWNDGEHGGFSTADAVHHVRPVIDGGPFGYDRVNVADQRSDPDSLLSWMRELIELRKGCPEVGSGRYDHLETDPEGIFAHRIRDDESAVIAAHDLSATERTVTLPVGGESTELFGNATVEHRNGAVRVDLPAYGRCWLRVDGR
jgi:maltose alpha-D-glucosyltransferase/alpha-amylase